MFLIDGEKYESRAQRNTLNTFFWSYRLLSPPTHGKGFATAKKVDEKILKVLRHPWHVMWSILGLNGVCRLIFLILRYELEKRPRSV